MKHLEGSDMRAPARLLSCTSGFHAWHREGDLRLAQVNRCLPSYDFGVIRLLDAFNLIGNHKIIARQASASLDIQA